MVATTLSMAEPMPTASLGDDGQIVDPVIKPCHLGLGLTPRKIRPRWLHRPTLLPGSHRAAANRCGAHVPCLVFTAIVDDALPAQFDRRKQSLRPYCGSDAASEANHKNRHLVPQSICLSRTSIASSSSDGHARRCLDDFADVARSLLNSHIRPFSLRRLGWPFKAT